MSEPERIEPIGLLPSEVTALRKSAGVDEADFGVVFGVSSNVVERWENRGIPSGPTALAVRLVAREMDFDFPEASADDGEPCGICRTPASESIHGVPVCASCHRDPVESMEELGWTITRTRNHISGYETIHVAVPEGQTISVTGRFMSEGLGTMLTKLFKDEPEIGDPAWDDAVYVHWVEPGLATFDEVSQTLIKALVAYGMVDIDPTAIDVQHAPNWGAFDDEIVLFSGLLASRL